MSGETAASRCLATKSPNTRKGSSRGAASRLLWYIRVGDGANGEHKGEVPVVEGDGNVVMLGGGNQVASLGVAVDVVVAARAGQEDLEEEVRRSMAMGGLVACCACSFASSTAGASEAFTGVLCDSPAAAAAAADAGAVAAGPAAAAAADGSGSGGGGTDGAADTIAERGGEGTAS
ncbi:unnamed protein product [Closterium sp. NIES-53]